MNFKELLNFKKITLSSDCLSKGTSSLNLRSVDYKNLIKFVIASFVASLLMEPSIVSAATGSVTGGVMTSFEGGVQILINWLTGTIAKSVAILSVVLMGFMAMVGKLAWDSAAKVILGIVLIFSAAQIVGLLVT